MRAITFKLFTGEFSEILPKRDIDVELSSARVTGSYVVKKRYIDYQPAHSAGVDNPSMVLQRTSRLNKVFKSPFLRENVSPNAQLGGPCFEVNVQNIHKMSTCEDAVFPLNNVRNGSLS